MLGLLLPLAACTSTKESDLPARQIPLPPALSSADRVFWSPTDVLVIGDPDGRTWYQTAPDTAWQRLATQHLCDGRPAAVTQVLTDGRLVMVCPVGLHNQRVLWQLFVYDWTTQQLELLVDTVLPASGSTTWSHDMQHGVLSTGPSYSTLYWLTATSMQVFTATITKDDKAWSFADTPQVIANYEASPGVVGRSPQTVGEVGAVGWSPVTDQIAFWATLEPIGKTDVFLKTWTWDLYLMNTQTMQLDRVLEDVYGGGGIQWSPDGQWILYSTAARGSQPQGLWLFSIQTRQSTLLKKGPSGVHAWSPDGHHILVVRDEGEHEKAEAWLYDVSSLLNVVQKK